MMVVCFFLAGIAVVLSHFLYYSLNRYMVIIGAGYFIRNLHQLQCRHMVYYYGLVYVP